MSEISTFVFFDIETTGLPWQERNQTKITEFSLVAALRKDIMNTCLGDLPHVTKLTFLLNPKRPVNPEVVQLTGITDELLRNEPTFRQKFQDITSFLEGLPKPVCLVAHNGNTFDYKILLAECNDIHASLPIDLLCLDSLPGFRSILKGTNIDYNFLKEKLEDILIDDDEDEDWPELNVSQEEWNEIDDICSSLSDISIEISEDEIEDKENLKRNRSELIKKIFNSKKSETPDNVKVKECYKMPDLYKRLLNKEENNAHRAEVDCVMLVECVVAIKEDFLPWADNHCKLLTEIQPLSRQYNGPKKYNSRNRSRM